MYQQYKYISAGYSWHKCKNIQQNSWHIFRIHLQDVSLFTRQAKQMKVRQIYRYLWKCMYESAHFNLGIGCILAAGFNLCPLLPRNIFYRDQTRLIIDSLWRRTKETPRIQLLNTGLRMVFANLFVVYGETVKRMITVAGNSKLET